MLDYLKEKTEKENLIEKEKLELERERINLEKRRQEMEIERFKIEKEERIKMLELISNIVKNK